VRITSGDSIIKTQTSNLFPRKKLLTESLYHWYGSGKINVNQGSFSGKVLHGKYEVFDRNNRMVRQGKFEYGLKQGIWTVWYANGFKKEITVYKDGILTEERLSFDINGRIISKEKYHKGVLHGKSYFYQADTVIVKEFRDGREIIKTTKPKKLKKPDSQKNRRPVFSRFYKSKSANDSIPFNNSSKTESPKFKKKKHAENEIPLNQSDQKPNNP
jgi:hypothetical protein